MSSLKRAWALVALLALVLTACGSATPAPSGGGSATPAASGGATTAVAPKSGGTLKIGMSQEVLTLDIPNYKSTQDLLVGGLMFESLLYLDKDSKVQPGLASAYKQTDPVTYEFTLRSGVKFHDGTPLNAAAVKNYFEFAIKGLKSSRFYDTIKTITTEGDSKVTFTLKQPFTPFAANIAFTTGFIMSPSSFAKGADAVVRTPIGTGPFKMTDWTGSTIKLVRNDDYWRGKPLLEGITLTYVADEQTRMASLEAGEIDVIQNAPPSRAKDLKTSAKLQLLTRPYAQSLWLGFTHSYGPLKDLRVRQAIAMVIDRKALVEGVTEGINRVATGFIPPEVMTEQPKPITGDVAAAKKLMADAGFANGFSIDLWTSNGTYLKDNEQGQAIQPMLKQIGIDAKLKPLQYAAYSDGLRRHEGQLFILGWAHTTSPDGFWRGTFLSTSLSNWSDYKNPKIDEIMNRSVTQPNAEAALKDFQTISQMLVDDAVGVPISYSSLLYAAGKKVHDFNPTAYGTWADIHKTWLE